MSFGGYTQLTSLRSNSSKTTATSIFPSSPNTATFSFSQLGSREGITSLTQGQPELLVDPGGYEYNDTVSGDCGEETLSANTGIPIPGAYQIVSTCGTISDPNITVHWTNYKTGASGTIPLYMGGGSTSYLDTFYANAGSGKVALFVSGSFWTSEEGKCTIISPAISFDNS